MSDTIAQEVAQRCLAVMEWYPGNFTNTTAGCSASHIKNILTQVANAEVTGDKAHRFVGWAQGVLCMEGYITLDSARNMNREVIEEAQ